MSTPDASKKIKEQLQAFSIRSYIYQSMVAETFGLHPTNMLAIHYLDQKRQMTAGQLGAALGLTTGATTAVIDRLVKAGFATREHRGEDRRRVYISLNPTNIKKLKAKYSSIDQQLGDVLKDYSKRDLQTINQFLNALSQLD